VAGFPFFFSFGERLRGIEYLFTMGKENGSFGWGFRTFIFSAYDHSFIVWVFFSFFFFLEMDSRLSRFFFSRLYLCIFLFTFIMIPLASLYLTDSPKVTLVPGSFGRWCLGGSIACYDNDAVSMVGGWFFFLISPSPCMFRLIGCFFSLFFLGKGKTKNQSCFRRRKQNEGVLNLHSFFPFRSGRISLIFYPTTIIKQLAFCRGQKFKPFFRSPNFDLDHGSLT